MELFLGASSKAGSPLVRCRDVPKRRRCLARCGFAAPAESAFSYAGLHMEEGSIWCVNGIPAQPLPPRCRAQSQEGGGLQGGGSMTGRQQYPVCAPWATIHRSWFPSASSSSWPNVLSSFCLFCSNSFLANTILRVVLILIDEAGAQSCLGMVRHYLSRKINSHVHSSSFQKMEK